MFNPPWLLGLILLWLAGLVIGSAGVGRAGLRGLGFRTARISTEWVLGIGLGLAALSYVVFALAALQGLSLRSLEILSGVWILASGLHFILPQASSAPAGAWSKLNWAQTGLLVLLMACHGLPAMLPAVDWDGLAYHLALPKIYLAGHGFIFRPDIFHNLFPQFTEMLYTLGLIFPFGIASKLIHWGFGVLAAAALYEALRTRLPRTWALWGTLFFYAQFIVHVESGTAFIDLAFTAYAAMAWLAYENAAPSEPPLPWLNLAMVLLGITAAIKWHGLIFMGLGLGLMVLRRIPSRRQLWRCGGMLLLCGIMPSLPYMMRAWILGGNPIWPLGYSIFGGTAWNLDIAQRVALVHATFAGVSRTALGFLQLPWDLVMHGKAFGVGGHELRFPLLAGVLVAAAGWIHWAQAHQSQRSAFPGRGIALLAALAVYCLIWYISSPQIRFILPWFPLGIGMGVCAMAKLWASGRAWARTAVMVSGVLFFMVHPPIHRNSVDQLRVILGQVEMTDYCSKELQHYPACQFLNQHVRPGERVLLFGENRGFYLEVDYLWGDPMMQAWVDFNALHTPQQLLDRLYELEVGWVLWRTDLYPKNYLRPEWVQRLSAVLDVHGELKYQAGAIHVYAVHASPPAQRAQCFLEGRTLGDLR